MINLKQAIICKWLKAKAHDEFALYRYGLTKWKQLVGWDRGGSAIPAWVSVNEHPSHKKIREDSWHHFKMARVYDIAWIRAKKRLETRAKGDG